MVFEALGVVDTMICSYLPLSRIVVDIDMPGGCYPRSHFLVMIYHSGH